MSSQKSASRRLLSSALSFLLISAFLFVSLMAFAGMNKSAAWFASVKEVTGEGMSVSVDAPYDIYAKVTSYAVSNISGTAYTASTQEAYNLPTVDPRGISYSNYQNALVIVLELSATQAQRANVSLVTPNTTVSYASENHISNCMQITAASFDSSSRVATKTGTTLHFVDLTDEKPEKISSITLSSSVEIKANVKTTLCYVIEYSDTLDDYMLNPTGDVDEMFFRNDISFVVTSVN